MAISKQYKEMVKQRNAVERARAAEMAASTEETIKDTEEVLEEFDFADLEAIDTRHKNVASTVKGSGCMTIINHERCGRRVHLANPIWRRLGCPPYLKLYLKGDLLFVTASTSGGIAVKFDRTIPFEKAVESYHGKVVLYATETVKRLTAEWDLEFDFNCCYTGGTFKECTINGTLAIVISKNGEVTAVKEEPEEETIEESKDEVEMETDVEVTEE